MSGHNKWSQIKTKKGATDKKRGNLFGKLLKAISIAAKTARRISSNLIPAFGQLLKKQKKTMFRRKILTAQFQKASEEKDLGGSCY